jgi:lipopolysaccharide biosynthesis regulator YciM
MGLAWIAQWRRLAARNTGKLRHRKNQEMDKAISRLEEAVLDPECPSMVKNILANIYRKQGNLKRVAEIYLDMANSRDKSYASFAVDRLKELSARHPAGK